MAHAALAGSLSLRLATAVSHGTAQNLIGFGPNQPAAPRSNSLYRCGTGRGSTTWVPLTLSGTVFH